MSSSLRRLAFLFPFLASIGPLCAQWDLQGAAAIQQALARLNTTGSVLMIAAHPDDENNPVLAWLSRGRHFRTAYLSATRGEGGQNLIGSEQGDQLGIIRTQELLAARRVDGAGQFFTRAIDFGFSKSAAETLAQWGREEVLADMVWVIRRFRPDVIVLTFSGTSRDGHGHHQASAMLGREAFEAAGDPSRFAAQLARVRPWRPHRVVQSLYDRRFGAGSDKDWLAIDPGAFDPVLGRSYAEIGGISRSMHRCQAEGSPERRGSLRYYLVPVAGPKPSGDLMEGIDATWKRLKGGAEVGRLLAQAAAEFAPAHPEKIAPLLAQARARLAAIDDPLARVRLPELDETLALCAGFWVEAQAERAEAVPGAELGAAVNLLARSALQATVERIELGGMWGGTLPAPAGPLPFNRVERIEFRRNVPAGQPLTQPYWLVGPRRGARYSVADASLIGEPETPPAASVRVRLRIDGATIELRRPLLHRYVDRALGERTRPLAIVPPAAAIVPQQVALFPEGGPRRVQAAVRANVASAAGEVRLELPAGWKAEPASAPFSIAGAGEQQEVSFRVTPPVGESTATLRASAVYRGRATGWGMHAIAYPHFPVQVLFPPAEATLVRADVRTTARRVGYIMGAGDLMPEALRQMGCEVTLLGRSDLEQGDLARYDAIVAGVRAYNVRPDLRANQPRLLEYVRQGGTYVVQYNTAEPSLPALGPYPFTVARDRVSVEDAPVERLTASHPLLAGPNRIGAADFTGWIQERGLYFAARWDPRYQTVIASHDPGEKPLAGGLLYAAYGKGVYIYTGYSWFRQLPAGVPGAFRLFANLVSARQPSRR